MTEKTPSAALTKPELLAQWFQRVWTDEDPSAVDQMLAPEAVIKGMGNFDSVGPAAFKHFQQCLLRQVSGMKFTILRTMEDGDWLAALWTLTASRKPTGEPVFATGTAFVEIRDGRFTGGYNHFDSLGMFQDIGLLPADTVPRLLEGKALS